MKLLQIIFKVFLHVYFSSASPNMFGSRKRQAGKQAIANEFKSMADSTQGQIDVLKSENPFESAGAKAAMAKASRGAQAMQNRMFNTMGAGATPEAVVGAQGAASEALGSAAGAIAAGAEANKENRISNLEGRKTQEMGMYGSMGASAVAEKGSGWNTLFQGIDALGKVASGIGGAKTAFS